MTAVNFTPTNGRDAPAATGVRGDTHRPPVVESDGHDATGIGEGSAR